MGVTSETQTAKILRLLRRNGYMTNYELNRLCFRYGARIHELRREGHDIVSVHDHGSLWRFVYRYTPDERVPLTARLRLRRAGVPAQ